MKIFLICPVRDADAKHSRSEMVYVKSLENEGHDVHWPPRDTDQMADGISICRQNMEAIRNADEIHIFYNSKSQGVHFDMGMAFALGKKIVVVKNEPYGEGKSFPRMLDEWIDRV